MAMFHCKWGCVNGPSWAALRRHNRVINLLPFQPGPPIRHTHPNHHHPPSRHTYTQLTFNRSTVCGRAGGDKVTRHLQQRLRCDRLQLSLYRSCYPSRVKGFEVVRRSPVVLSHTYMQQPHAKESRRSLEQRREPRHANITPLSKYGLSIFGTRCNCKLGGNPWPAGCKGETHDQLDAGLVYICLLTK